MIFTNTHIFKKRWLFGCLLFFCTGCSESPGFTDQPDTRGALFMDSLFQLVKDGDVITRSGTDFTSQSLKQFSRTDNTYSHCGIVRVVNNAVHVYHAVGGELNPDAQLKKDDLAGFCDATQNEGIGLFRFPLTPSIKARMDSLIQQFYTTGVRFDLDFDLSTDDKMYCTEFVAKVLSRSFANEQMFDTMLINQKAYLAVDNIFLQKDCTEIARFVY